MSDPGWLLQDGGCREPTLSPLSPAGRFALAAAGLAFGLTVPQVPAFAELAPWVYGEQQRQAPLVVDLRILEVAAKAAPAEGIRVRGRVLGVRRQAAGLGVRPAQVLTLLLPAPPPPRQLPMVGPSPLRPPQVGARVTAWLRQAPEWAALWLPAAGGRSFGPSLEDSPDPNAAAAPGSAPLPVPGR